MKLKKILSLFLKKTGSYEDNNQRENQQQVTGGRRNRKVKKLITAAP